MTRPAINPFYSGRAAAHRQPAKVPTGITKRVIGNATLYRADCFDMLPTLADIGTVVTDPPYGIGYGYRSYDDDPAKYDDLMAWLVPELIRITGNGPCFVWQSPLKADRWHRYFPQGFRVIAACKQYPEHGKRRCASWDPVIFWSGTSLLRDELPRDWHLADLRQPTVYRGENPVPARGRSPRCDTSAIPSAPTPSSTRSWEAAPPASPPCSPASGSSASNAILSTSSMPASGSPQ